MIGSSCSVVEFVLMVSSNVEQQKEVKSGHNLKLELQDMMHSHGMKISSLLM
jgi:hypothetical protein